MSALRKFARSRLVHLPLMIGGLYQEHAILLIVIPWILRHTLGHFGAQVAEFLRLTGE